MARKQTRQLCHIRSLLGGAVTWGAAVLTPPEEKSTDIPARRFVVQLNTEIKYIEINIDTTHRSQLRKQGWGGRWGGGIYTVYHQAGKRSRQWDFTLQATDGKQIHPCDLLVAYFTLGGGGW